MPKKPSVPAKAKSVKVYSVGGIRNSKGGIDIVGDVTKQYYPPAQYKKAMAAKTANSPKGVAKRVAAAKRKMK